MNVSEQLNKELRARTAHQAWEVFRSASLTEQQVLFESMAKSNLSMKRTIEELANHATQAQLTAKRLIAKAAGMPQEDIDKYIF